MKKVFGDYYLGLDIGTDSVGWAVTDEGYNLHRLNGKDMWGVRLFDSGKTAAERRGFRTARRRNDRQNQRIALLQELFAEEIGKVDPGFFQRLADSKFYADDKKIHQTNTLFNDNGFNDKDYHRMFPTIYHLRKALIEGKDKVYDVRLVYLAVAHIIKHRGHFLLEGQTITDNASFAGLFDKLASCLYNELDITFPCNVAPIVADILRKSGDIKSKRKALEAVLGNESKEKKSFIALLSGATVALADLFADESYKSEETPKISFTGNQYDEKVDFYAAVLTDRMCCIEAAKDIYDWALLSDIMQEQPYISFAKVLSYDKHKNDLQLLKNVYKKHCSKSEYREMFSDNNQSANYCAYIRKSVAKNNKSTCALEEFCKYVKNKLKKFEAIDVDVQKLLLETENYTFLPKQTSGNNNVIPYQVHLKELNAILNNATEYLAFLNEYNADGHSVSEKIKMLLTFRIPYYVGPLNDAHKTKDGTSKCWIVKKSVEPIYPWNFERVVDLDASQEAFISRMTNKCTYLVGCDVLPKNSLLYSRFMILNELNNLRINGEKVTVEIKQGIFNNLFMRYRKVTQKRLKDYLLAEGHMEKSDKISGIDGDFKASLTSQIDLSEKIGEKVKDNNLAEEIIRTLVLFGKDKKALEKRLRNRFSGKLSGEDIRKIATLRYSGWGRLSKELLTEVYHIEPSTGESMSIIEKMYHSNENFMQLLSVKYGYKNEIDKRNAEVNGQNFSMTYENLVEPLYCSPAVKRGIWQTLTIVDEINKIMDHPPKKVFVEVAREDGEKKRTVSRRGSLMELYKKCRDEERDYWLKELDAKTDGELRKDKLYLYYTQMGRCMYSGDQIVLSQLYDDAVYDIDHIYPQSKTKDDSIDNRVLVKKGLNKDKGDRYPVPESFKTSTTRTLWKRLFEMALISKTKYDRLMRAEGFSDDELAGFISRQLVETRQSTKAVAEVLNRIYSSDETEIVYVKAGNVSDFRRDNSFVKVRELNDYHHARDAYLNIVVGNVYNTKFTNNPLNFIKDAKRPPYSLRKMYGYDVVRGGILAWRAGEAGTIATVNKTMSSNRIQFTRYSFEVTGGFFNQMPLKKGFGQFPLKSDDARLHKFERYGGYDNVYGAYFILVEHLLKGKLVRTIEYVPIRLVKKIAGDASALVNYCCNKEPFGLGLNEPRILIPKIKINTLFNIDGFPMHISGRTGDGITFKPAVQLCVDESSEIYLKKVIKYVERCKANSKNPPAITIFDAITKEENQKIYDMLLTKHTDTIYRLRPSSQVKTLEKGKEIFYQLPPEQQCEAICNILKLFKCIFGTTDLKAIGGSGQAGIPKKNKNISQCTKAAIIYQSPTGIFSTEIDLLAL